MTACPSTGARLAGATYTLVSSDELLVGNVIGERYQVRDMLDVHIDDVTLDVMRVGDGQNKGMPHLFVVAAPNAVLRDATDLAELMRWNMHVMDVQETAQRNLQNALETGICF